MATPHPWTHRDTVITVHAVTAIVATFLTAPVAILIARYFRSRGPSWFKWHLVLQVFTVALIVVTFGTGTWFVADDGKDNGFVGKSKHFSIGLAAFILTLVVALLGLVAHYSKVKTQSGPSIVAPNKSVFHYAHWTIAVVVVGLWYSQIFTGIKLYNQPGRAIPHGLVIAFWVFMAVQIAMWVGGLSLEYNRFRYPLGKPKTLSQQEGLAPPMRQIDVDDIRPSNSMNSTRPLLR